MHLQEFVDHIQQQGFQVELKGGEYRAQCPAHGGKDRNLAIGLGDNGSIVCKCHSHGCKGPEVAAAVGLTIRDLMPPRTNGERHSLDRQHVYPYRDERGECLFEVIREADKRFWQRLPGSERGGIGSVRRVLFGLPELLKTKPGDLVVITEGEKDALNVALLGIAATTNPHGAGRWKEEYTQWLATNLPDRRFIILPDNDQQGHSHADEVLGSLTRAGLIARIVGLPDVPAKGDVSDWIRLGGTGDKLRQLAEPPPPRLLQKLWTWDRLLEEPDPVWQLEGLFFEQTLVEVFGPPNSGKTFLTFDMALAIRRGGTWFGHEVKKPGAVLYVNADGGRGFAKRARAAVEVYGREAAEHEFWTFPESISLHDPASMAEFVAMLAWIKDPPAAVIFDTYSRCIPGVNENLQEVASLVVEHLDRMRQEIGSSVILLHHTNISGEHARGSSVILGACDTQIRTTKDESGVVNVHCEKQRDAEYFDDFHFEIRHLFGTNHAWLQQSGQLGEVAINRKERRYEAALEKALNLICEEPGITRERLAYVLDVAENTAKKYAHTLIMRGVVMEKEVPEETVRRGRKCRGLYLLPPSEDASELGHDQT